MTPLHVDPRPLLHLEWASLTGGMRPPARTTLARSGWRPDPPGTYCHRCGSSVGKGELTGRGCAGCRDVTARPARIVRLGAYDTPLDDWVRALKYGGWAAMARELGRRLGTAVRSGCALAPGRTLVVPMPMPPVRRLYRNIDHAGLLAEAAAAALGGRVGPVLRRVDPLPQAGRGATARRGLAATAIRARRRSGRVVRGRDVVLIDDVRTTGASLRVAARALEPLGPRRIIAAVVAVADDPARRQTSTRPSRMA